MEDKKKENASLEELSRLCTHIANMTQVMSEQSAKLQECTPMYQDILNNLREVIGDQTKSLGLAREAAYQEGISYALAAFISDDIRQKDILGNMLFGQRYSKNTTVLRERLKKQLNIVLFPSEDAVPNGYDGDRGMAWTGDVEAADGLDKYTFFSLEDGGVPEPDIMYNIAEFGWLLIEGENEFRPLRKALIDRNPRPKGRRGRRSSIITNSI